MEKSDKHAALVHRLEEAVSPVVENLGFDLVELQFVGARRRPILRLFIDKDGGVTLDDCATASRHVGERLDLLDVLPGPYHLEVSSPGITRPFRSLKQFLRSLDRTIEVFLSAPVEERTEYRGVLVAASAGSIRLQVSGREVEIPMDLVKRANRVVEL